LATIGECEEVAEPTVKAGGSLQEQETLAEELAQEEVRIADTEKELARLNTVTENTRAKLQALDSSPWTRLRRMLQLLVKALEESEVSCDIVDDMSDLVENQCGGATPKNIDETMACLNETASARKKLQAQQKTLAKSIKDKKTRLAEVKATIEEQEDKVLAWERWKNYRGLTASMKEATEGHKKAKEDVEDFRKELAALSIKIEEQEALVKEGRKVQKAKVELANKCRNEADELDRSVKSINKDYKQAKADEVKIKEELSAAEIEVKRIEAELGTLGPAEALEAQKQAIGEELAKLAMAMERRREFETISKNYAAELAQAATAEATVEVAAAAEAAAKAMRSRLISDQAEPLLAKVNAFLNTAYPGHTAYCDLVSPKGSIVCELGLLATSEPNVRVPWEAFSGWQNAMFGAALAYAFSTMQERPLRVLTVEMDGVDADNRLALMQALAAVGEDLSNVLVATCWPFSDEHTATLAEAGWNIINIEEKAA